MTFYGALYLIVYNDFVTPLHMTGGPKARSNNQAGMYE
jgi:hypothetical protein